MEMEARELNPVAIELFKICVPSLNKKRKIGSDVRHIDQHSGSHLRAAKAQMSLCICIVSPEPFPILSEQSDKV